MDSFNLLIDGRLVAGDATMPVVNPATEEVLVQCPRASVDQLNKAVAAAKAAFPGWAATPIGERRKAIVRMAEVIEKNSGELARILTQEQGKPIGDATAETLGMAGFFRYFASLDLPMRVIEDSAGRKPERPGEMMRLHPVESAIAQNHRECKQHRSTGPDTDDPPARNAHLAHLAGPDDRFRQVGDEDSDQEGRGNALYEANPEREVFRHTVEGHSGEQTDSNRRPACPPLPVSSLKPGVDQDENGGPRHEGNR